MREITIDRWIRFIQYLVSISRHHHEILVGWSGLVAYNIKPGVTAYGECFLLIRSVLSPRGMFRDHFLYAPSHRETTLHCNIVSHWRDAYTKWSLHISYMNKPMKDQSRILFSMDRHNHPHYPVADIYWKFIWQKGSSMRYCGPIYTKWVDVLPPDFMKSWSRDIRVCFCLFQSLWNLTSNSTVKLPRYLSNFVITSDLAVSRLREIGRLDVLPLGE